jgi:hypothetical protein
MSATSFRRVDLAMLWRNRDRTFERAVGRHLAVAIVFGLWVIVSVLENGVAGDESVLDLVVVIAGLAGLVFLIRWFGGGSILLGLALALLSIGLSNAVVAVACFAHDLLLIHFASSHDRMGCVVKLGLSVGLFALCWFGLKRAEARL